MSFAVELLRWGMACIAGYHFDYYMRIEYDAWSAFITLVGLTCALIVISDVDMRVDMCATQLTQIKRMLA
jgi:hypothetical protein